MEYPNLARNFRNPEILIEDIYKNAGTRVRGWGYISGGYGGGVDQEEAIRLIWCDGYLDGMIAFNIREFQECAREINEALKLRGVPENNLPFINL